MLAWLKLQLPSLHLQLGFTKSQAFLMTYPKLHQGFIYLNNQFEAGQVSKTVLGLCQPRDARFTATPPRTARD